MQKRMHQSALPPVLRKMWGPSKHFWVLQALERKCFVKVKKMMGKKTIYNRMFLKHFMHTVYQTFNDKC